MPPVRRPRQRHDEPAIGRRRPGRARPSAIVRQLVAVRQARSERLIGERRARHPVRPERSPPGTVLGTRVAPDARRGGDVRRTPRRAPTTAAAGRPFGLAAVRPGDLPVQFRPSGRASAPSGYQAVEAMSHVAGGDDAAGRRHAAHLRERGDRVGQVLEDLVGVDDVEPMRRRRPGRRRRRPRTSRWSGRPPRRRRSRSRAARRPRRRRSPGPARRGARGRAVIVPGPQPTSSRSCPGRRCGSRYAAEFAPSASGATAARSRGGRGCTAPVERSPRRVAVTLHGACRLRGGWRGGRCRRHLRGWRQARQDGLPRAPRRSSRCRRRCPSLMYQMLPTASSPKDPLVTVLVADGRGRGLEIREIGAPPLDHRVTQLLRLDAGKPERPDAVEIDQALWVLGAGHLEIGWRLADGGQERGHALAPAVIGEDFRAVEALDRQRRPGHLGRQERLEVGERVSLGDLLVFGRRLLIDDLLGSRWGPRRVPPRSVTSSTPTVVQPAVATITAMIARLGQNPGPPPGGDAVGSVPSSAALARRDWTPRSRTSTSIDRSPSWPCARQSATLALMTPRERQV